MLLRNPDGEHVQHGARVPAQRAEQRAVVVDHNEAELGIIFQELGQRLGSSSTSEKKEGGSANLCMKPIVANV